MKQSEDLTLDEDREQMVLYQRLYYKLRMQNNDYTTATRERKGLNKQRMKEDRGEKNTSVPNRKYSMDNMVILSRIRLRNKMVVIVLTITIILDEKTELFCQLMCA